MRVSDIILGAKVNQPDGMKAKEERTVTGLASAIDGMFFAPLRRPRTRRVGVELELPIWNQTPGAATDFDAVHAATEEFLSRFNFPDKVFDDMGALYRVRDTTEKNEDKISRQ